MKNLLCYLGLHDYWMIAPNDGQVERGLRIGYNLAEGYHATTSLNPLHKNWDRACAAQGCNKVSLRLDAYLTELERIAGVVEDAKKQRLAAQEGKE